MERVRWLRVIVTAVTITACISYVHLSSTEHHAVVHPNSVAHGTVQVGASSLRFVTISPATGEHSDIVQSIAEQAGGCPNFAINLLVPLPAEVSSTCSTGSGSGSGVDVGSDTGSGSGSGSGGCDSFTTISYTFQTVFTPTITGAQTCTLNLQISGQASTITLSGTGVAPPIDIELETGPNANNTARCTTCVLPFGPTNVGLQATPQVVKVVNAGTGNANIASVTTSAPFVILSGDTSNAPLGPGGSEVYSVTCAPQAEFAPLVGSLVITTNDPAQAVHTVELRCSGVDSELSANTLSVFTRVHETVVTNDPPLHPPLTLANVGSAQLTITGITFDPPGLASDFSFTGVTVGNTINAGASRTVVFTYTPTTPVGNPIGTVIFQYDPGNKTREVAINGPVVDTTLSLSPTGPSGLADLGVACVGSTKTQTFTLLANNDGDFDLRSISILIPSPPIYAVVPRTPATLPTPGMPHALSANGANSVEFDITFTPVEPVLVPNGFSLATDIPSPAGPQSFGVGLMGTGLPSGQNVSPEGPIDFGTIKTGETTLTPRAVDFTNCSPEPLAITRAEIVGDQDFRILEAPSFEVGANASVAFGLVLSPEFGGAKRATLEIEYAGGLSSVTLIGNGDGPLAPVDDLDQLDPRDSYYACSTGRASGSVFVWLVVGWMIVRRRRR